MDLKTDTTTFDNCIETLFFLLCAFGAALKKYGIIDLILTKLKVHSSVAASVAQQGNETAIAKLQVPDDVLSLLNAFATDDTGKIILETAAQVLQDQGRFNTLINLSRPLTEPEKDEFISIVKRVMKQYRN